MSEITTHEYEYPEHETWEQKRIRIMGGEPEITSIIHAQDISYDPYLKVKVEFEFSPTGQVVLSIDGRGSYMFPVESLIQAGDAERSIRANLPSTLTSASYSALPSAPEDQSRDPAS